MADDESLVLSHMREVDAELKEVAVELNRVRAAKRKREQKGPHAGLSMQLLWATLYLFILSDHCLQVPVWYLWGVGRSAAQAGFAEYEQRDLEALVSDSYIGQDFENLLALEEDPTAFLPYNTVKSLIQYVVEWKLYTFTTHCNAQLGLTPTATLIEARHASFIPKRLSLSDKFQVANLLTNRGWQRKQFLYNFRRRWHITIGKLPVVPSIPFSDRLQRAPW